MPPRPVNDLDKNISEYRASLGKPVVDFLHSPIVRNAPQSASRSSSLRTAPTATRLSQIPTPESESDSEDEFFRSNSNVQARVSARPSTGAASVPPRLPDASTPRSEPSSRQGSFGGRVVADNAGTKDTPATQATQPSQPGGRTHIEVDLTQDVTSPKGSRRVNSDVISIDSSSPPRPGNSDVRVDAPLPAEYPGLRQGDTASNMFIPIPTEVPASPALSRPRVIPSSPNVVPQTRETSSRLAVMNIAAQQDKNDEEDYIETEYLSDSSFNGRVHDSKLKPPAGARTGQSHFLTPGGRERQQQPHIVYSQSLPVTQQQTIGPLLTEKIGLLERKVAYLEGILKRSGATYDTSRIDGSLRQVMKRIDAFHAGEDGLDESDYDDLPSAHGPRQGAIFSSPARPDTHFPISNRQDKAETQISSGDEDYDDPMLGIDTTNTTTTANRPAEASPYFSGKRDYPDDDQMEDLEPEMIVEVGTRSLSSSNEPVPATARIPAPATQVQKYTWSADVARTLKNKFGLSGFRPNQLEAVTATLEGRDVVVLMPTGGGKSLCYQLPALINSGKTHGTTVVISPLISLMQDQVYHLKNRNIEAEMINSQLSFAERSEAFDKLSSGKLELVYLSPEMLSASNQMNRVLTDLYSRDKLARLVIDEAHCVSQWGHDFRPDYRLLERLKGDFCRTPIMALTATANDRVLLDIVNCVRPECLVLKQSFNRPNINYDVVPKRTRGIMQDVSAICKRHAGRSGIIYCHSRTACEETASALRKEGIAASFYHAGMSVEERQETQTMWQEGTHCSVVCATIAFGMGIDKPDVRFVVHMTLPRNMEGYYQETGRAGRDGRRSWCTLFYNYADASMLMGLISRDENLTPQDKENHRNLLTCVVQYCENKTDCRRRQILQYFSESFDAADCGETCDNCSNMVGRRAIKMDVTQQAKLAVELLDIVASQKVTTLHCIDIMKGSKSKRVLDRKHDQLPLYGKLSSMDRTELERLFHHLVAEKILEEYSTFNMARYPQTYLRTGPLSTEILRGQRKVFLVTTDVVNNDQQPAQKRPRTSRGNTRTPPDPTTYGYAGGSSNAHPGQGYQANRGGARRGARGAARGGSRGGRGGAGRGRSYQRSSQSSHSSRQSANNSNNFVRMMS